MRMVKPFQKCVLVAACAAGAVASAQPAPDYDFTWSTIGAVGNPAYVDNDPDYAHQVVNGRGSVGYEYRMSTLEVTTGQWMEFLNTFGGANGTPNQFWHANLTWWNAERGTDGIYQLRTDVADAAMTPVFGVPWRMGGLYCNWLHNGKGSDPQSLLGGAYDVSTWGTLLNGQFTDASNHLPGARFWIPTLDEQLKAFQYDPDRYGEDQGGWWLARNQSDTLGTPGPPGEGTTSAGLPFDIEHPGLERNIALGAYPDSLSPWGLLDTSGGTSEWNEEIFPGHTPFGSFRFERGYMGSAAGDDVAWMFLDRIWGTSSGSVNSPTTGIGLRLASTVPNPTAALLVGIFVLHRTSTRRKGGPCVQL